MKLLEGLKLEFLTEALTRGSTNVLSDKKLVPELANTIRRDSRLNPGSFTAGFARQAIKMPDEELVTWFLDELDKLERDGYEGLPISRDRNGSNNDWISRKYVQGAHNWEDIKGSMPMSFRDWYALKSRGMLDVNHDELSKFKGIRDVGEYINRHYRQRLDSIRDELLSAAEKTLQTQRDKLARNIKLVDNDDYRIFVPLNWQSAQKNGRGTVWCTANSNHKGMFDRYSGEAMLYQIFPKAPEQVDKVSGFTGKRITGSEKYQFGPDSGLSFKDIADDQVRAETVSERFPYLYSDLVDALSTNKDKIQTAIDGLSNDETLKDKEGRGEIKKYDVDNEIKKLKKFVDRGYMSDEKRPAVEPEEPPPEEGQPMAESKMKTLGHIVKTTTFKPTGGNQESPLTYGDELEEDDEEFQQQDQAQPDGTEMPGPEDTGADQTAMQDDESPEEMVDSILSMQSLGLSKSQKHYDEHHLDQLMRSNPDQIKQIYDEVMGTVAEEDDSADLGSAMPAQGMGQQSNMAPTMPEGTIMEEIDKDVAAMLKSLKKYDMLAESVAPVLMARPKDNALNEFYTYDTKKNQEDKTWKKKEEDERRKKKKEEDQSWKYKSKKGLEEAEEIDEEDETVDQFIARGGKVKTKPTKPPRKGEGWVGSAHLGVLGGSGSKGSVTGRGASVNSSETSVPPVTRPVRKKAKEGMEHLDEISDAKADAAWNQRVDNLRKSKTSGNAADHAQSVDKITRAKNLQGGRTIKQQHNTQQAHTKLGQPDAPDAPKYDKLQTKLDSYRMNNKVHTTNEAADPDVLAWMERFSKLGKMV